MEPLSAFAVASNVLQFVEVGIKIISKAVEYRQSDNSLSAEHGELHNIADSLWGLNKTLSISLNDSTKTSVGLEEARLVDANRQCLRISEDFMAALDRLKVNRSTSLYDSVRMSIKALWNKDKIAAMEKSLTQARSNLNLALLVYISSKQAVQVTQEHLELTSLRSEQRILNGIVSSSDRLQNEVTTLGKQIQNLDISSSQKLINDFTASHESQMNASIGRICHAISSHDAGMMDNQRASTFQAFKKSLEFPQIAHRRDQIPPAYEETYKWILTCKSQSTQPWHNFLSWLTNSSDNQRLYWVSGKIGAGKTVLMRYLDENLKPSLHMSPWAEGHEVVRATYFFWGPGNKLQKCINGLLRTLLSQLIEQLPQESLQSSMPAKWRAVSSTKEINADWTDQELLAWLMRCVGCLGTNQRLLILIDGLDEIEDHEDAQDALLELLHDLAANPDIKICVSSRPWNVFKDSFGGSPSLRLENLTKNDITLFATQQLGTSRRYQNFLEHDKIAATKLVNTVVKRSSGVFLWVRLVVTQLIRSLRNGEGMISLQRRIDECPAALDDYFARLLQSIPSSDRSAASRLFQTALYTENEWITLHSNCLLDVAFLEYESPTFALASSFKFSELDLKDKDAVLFRLDSALRSVNSLGMGLIECHERRQVFEIQKFNVFSSAPAVLENETSHIAEYLSGSPSTASKSRTEIDAADPLSSASWTIEFLHRSLRDFLVTPKMQNLLHQYSEGAFDARMFYMNARMAQLIALARIDTDNSTGIGLASTLLCGFGALENSYRTQILKASTIIKPVVEKIARSSERLSTPGWYINCVLQSWALEESTFLTVAIDFAIYSYVSANLTAIEISTKTARPIMDYILRPRFAGCASQMYIGNQVPNAKLLHSVLRQGASPNAQYDNASLWALFLCAVADLLLDNELEDDLRYESASFVAMKMLLQHGADVEIPEHWLCARHYYFSYDDHTIPDQHMSTSILRLRQRFPGARPRKANPLQQHAMYLVSELLGGLQRHFTLSLDNVKTIALDKEAQLNS